MDSADHRVAGSQDAYYIPNFVTEDEEAYLIRKVSGELIPENLVIATRNAAHFFFVLRHIR